MAEPWDIEEPEHLQAEPHLRTGELSGLIDAYMQSALQPEIRRYIGASSIGHPCERKIWYGYQGIEGLANEPQTQRTFDIGHKLEDLVLEYLDAAGIELITIPDMTSFQDPDISALQGHVDAIIWDKGRKAILELKTARDSSFNVFVKGGLRKWYPIYYAQVQCYMGMSGIHEAYVLAINKDTSKLHDEHVSFDAGCYEEIRTKAQRILAFTEAPAKINNNPCYFTCRMCNYRNICHGG